MSDSHNRHQIDQTPSRLLEDAELALENLARKEVQLVKEAEELFKNQVDYIKMIDDLRKFVPNMQKIDHDTRKLSTLVDSPSSLVEDVCGKVRQIDLAKGRLDDCLSKIGDLLDLGTCRDGMMEAMRLGNYEEAAINIKRYLSIDQRELQKTLDIIGDSYKQTLGTEIEDKQKLDPKSMAVALEQLEESKVNLLKICRINLSNAIKEANTKEIERYFKIFPMLNEHDEGLEKYSEYLISKIVDPLEDESMKAKKMNQADKLGALFESIAKLIDSNQALVETYYGPGHLISVVKIIQRNCDRLSRKILEEFRNETKLQYVAKTVRASLLQAPGQFLTAKPNQMYNPTQNTSLNLNPSKLDPREVDKMLNEISMIISRSEVYLNFIVQRISDDISLTTEGEKQKQSGQIKIYSLVCNECELNHLIQEVGGIHVMLEQFYLNESSKKAILMDQIDVESSGCFVSSMLDDIFFIIKKCTKRAVSTKSIEVFCAVINHCVTLLDSTFCKFLEDRVLNQQYFSTTAFTTKNFDLSQAYSAIKSALNNLDKAGDYIRVLKELLDSDVKKLKPSLTVHQQNQDLQMEKPRTCLIELSQLSNKFNSVANSSLYQLFNASFRNRLTAELKIILSENPDLSGSDPDAVDGLAKTMLIRLDAPLRNYLSCENYNKLISITRDFLASSLRKK